MKNNYTKAVDYLQQYVEATEKVQEDLPGVQSSLEYAIFILKSNESYEGSNPNLPKQTTSVN